MIMSSFLMQSVVEAERRGELWLLCIPELLLRLAQIYCVPRVDLQPSLRGPAERAELTELYYLFQ